MRVGKGRGKERKGYEGERGEEEEWGMGEREKSMITEAEELKSYRQLYLRDTEKWHGQDPPRTFHLNQDSYGSRVLLYGGRVLLNCLQF